MTDPIFDPLKMLDVLHRHRVRFIMIGGLAGRLWGSPTVTNDLDICHARDRANLGRLAEALREARARLRGVAEEIPFLLDDRTLGAGDHFTFVTDAGNLDCMGAPAGTNGYDDLARTAEEMEIGEHTIQVASIEDLIRMKLAAGRPKDRIEAEILTAVREEIESEGDR
jgi:hypothetical protein